MTTRIFQPIQFLLIFSIIATLSACGEAPASSQGKVAVIDIQRIAKATGWDVRINDEVARESARWEQILAEEGTKIDQEIRAKREEIGEEPTQEQIVEFNRVRNEGQEKFNEVQAQRDAVMRQKIAQLQGQFREEVRPYARKAGDTLGFKIVIINSDMLLSHDSGSDITDAVIASLLSAGKKYTAQSTAPSGAPDAPGEAADGEATSPDPQPTPPTEPAPAPPTP